MIHLNLKEETQRKVRDGISQHEPSYEA